MVNSDTNVHVRFVVVVVVVVGWVVVVSRIRRMKSERLIEAVKECLGQCCLLAVGIISEQVHFFFCSFLSITGVDDPKA